MTAAPTAPSRVVVQRVGRYEIVREDDPKHYPHRLLPRYLVRDTRTGAISGGYVCEALAVEVARQQVVSA